MLGDTLERRLKRTAAAAFGGLLLVCTSGQAAVPIQEARGPNAGVPALPREEPAASEDSSHQVPEPGSGNSADAPSRPTGAAHSLPPGDRRFVLATGQVLTLNLAMWALNYTVRGHQTFHISPETIWRNLGRAQFDVNRFGMNQFGHPYNGGLYYNAGRSNGYGVLPSAAFTLAGSYLWECCFEAEPTSVNDLVNTTFGGISFGETTHRLAALTFRPEATGLERFGRGLLAFLVDPIGGFTRLATGRTAAAGRPYGRVGAVPLRVTMRSGARGSTMREGSAAAEGPDGALLDVHIGYGDPFRYRRSGAYDYFDLLLQLDLGSDRLISRLSIDGVFASKAVGAVSGARHVLGINQRFELYRNAAFEYGAPSVTAGLMSSFPISETIAARTSVALEGVILGGVGSEHYERRSNDYGPGFGGIAEVSLTHRGFALLRAGYSSRWIYVVDGAATRHRVQAFGAGAAVPVFRMLGVGLDYSLYFRDSYYREFDDVHPRQHELRAYAALFAG
jgi:hypothetical protein